MYNTITSNKTNKLQYVFIRRFLKHPSTYQRIGACWCALNTNEPASIHGTAVRSAGIHGTAVRRAGIHGTARAAPAYPARLCAALAYIVCRALVCFLPVSGRRNLPEGLAWTMPEDHGAESMHLLCISIYNVTWNMRRWSADTVLVLQFQLC